MENKNTKSEILFYSSEDGKSKIEVRLEDETVWLTQQQMAELFKITKQNVSLHIKNIYKEGELPEKATVKDYLTLQTEGKREVQRSITYYNLDVIISVGYRVKSLIGTQFRIWATQQLKEYIIKGFILDDNRLKQGREAFGKDYFRELLDRVRSIRASERRIWQQITDIFAECSIDYDKNSPTTKDFYAMIQNKFHYAIIGQTAAEIIYTKANKESDNKRNTPFRTCSYWLFRLY